jgi:tetratricopeptide (TPR) repeat protein
MAARTKRDPGRRPPRPASTSSADSAAPDRSLLLLTSLALAALVAIVFAQLAGHAFITLDDGLYVTRNPVVQGGLTWANVSWALTAGAPYWHPVTWLSHMLDVELFGMNAGGHHAVSVLLHIVNTILLFLLLNRLTGSAGRSAVVAALFGVHPLHVESVAWAAERKDVLSTLFLWLTLWWYVAYVRQRDWRRYALVAAMFALGLMSKPMVVTTPAVMLLLDFWPLRRVTGLQPASWMPLIVEKIPLFLMSIGSTVITFLNQDATTAVVHLDKLSLGDRLANAVVSYCAYLAKTVWPVNLAVFYPDRHNIPLADVALAAAALVALSVAAWRLARSHPYVPVGWLWYLGTLLPVIGLSQVGDQAMADRFTYVPMVGILIIVVWGAAELASAIRLPMAGLRAAAAAAVVACASIAFVQASYWQDDATLWTHALAATPDSYMAHHVMGGIALDSGRTDEALAQSAEAVRLNPGFSDARANHGLALMDAHRLDEAIAEYREAVRLKPVNPEFHLGLGVALATNGGPKEAVAEYSEAIRLNPSSEAAYFNRGVALAGLGNTAAAIRDFTEVLRINPNNANARQALAKLGGK